MTRPHQIPPYPGADIIPAKPLPPAPGWPMAMHFTSRKDKLVLCMYERIAYRAPKAGEHYASGAIVAAYRAPQDLPESSRYWIVRPTHHARRMGLTRGPVADIDLF